MGRNVPATDSAGGADFDDPARFTPIEAAATAITAYNAASGSDNSSATAFFTEMARRGIQDQTDWTADTYKSIVNLTGSGVMAGYIGCTAGGTETHTVEITVDGVLKELAIPVLGTGRRGLLMATMVRNNAFTTGDNLVLPDTEALNAAKTVITGGSAQGIVPTWGFLDTLSIPLLRFKSSLLVRAKHSTNITNSTATAYSAVLYMKDL